MGPEPNYATGPVSAGSPASGLDQKAYRDLIADIGEIAGDGFGVDMIVRRQHQ